MAWLRIVSYALEYLPGDVGFVYYRCVGDSNFRRTNPLPVEMFNAVCNVLRAGPADINSDKPIFRSSVGGGGDTLHLEQFVKSDFNIAKAKKKNAKVEKK